MRLRTWCSVSPVPDAVTVWRKQSLLRGLRPPGREAGAAGVRDGALGVAASWAWPGQQEVLVALEVSQMPGGRGLPRSERRRYTLMSTGLREGLVGFAMVRRGARTRAGGARARFILGSWRSGRVKTGR